MPSFAFLTFCCVFFAVSRTLLQPPSEKKPPAPTPETVQVDVSTDCWTLEDLEKVVEIATVLQNATTKR